MNISLGERMIIWMIAGLFTGPYWYNIILHVPSQSSIAINQLCWSVRTTHVAPKKDVLSARLLEYSTLHYRPIPYEKGRIFRSRSSGQAKLNHPEFTSFKHETVFLRFVNNTCCWFLCGLGNKAWGVTRRSQEGVQEACHGVRSPFFAVCFGLLSGWIR